MLSCSGAALERAKMWKKYERLYEKNMKIICSSPAECKNIWKNVKIKARATAEKYETSMKKYEKYGKRGLGVGRLGLQLPAGSGDHSKYAKVWKSVKKVWKNMKKYENI